MDRSRFVSVFVAALATIFTIRSAHAQQYAYCARLQAQYRAFLQGMDSGASMALTRRFNGRQAANTYRSPNRYDLARLRKRLISKGCGGSALDTKVDNPPPSRDRVRRRQPARNMASGGRTLCVRLCDGYYFPIDSAQTAAATRLTRPPANPRMLPTVRPSYSSSRQRARLPTPDRSRASATAISLMPLPIGTAICRLALHSCMPGCRHWPDATSRRFRPSKRSPRQSASPHHLHRFCQFRSFVRRPQKTPKPLPMPQAISPWPSQPLLSPTGRSSRCEWSVQPTTPSCST